MAGGRGLGAVLGSPSVMCDDEDLVDLECDGPLHVGPVERPRHFGLPLSALAAREVNSHELSKPIEGTANSYFALRPE